MIYSSGHDMLIVNKEDGANLSYDIKARGADLIVKIGGDIATITVTGGAKAYRDGLFGIAEAKFPGGDPVFDLPQYDFRTIAGSVHLAGGKRMVGGAGDDTLLLRDPQARVADGEVVMTGGGGADTFVLSGPKGLDSWFGSPVKITDFNVRQGDKLSFDESTGINSFSDLMKAGRFDSAGFHIALPKPGAEPLSISIMGLDSSELTQVFKMGNLIF